VLPHPDASEVLVHATARRLRSRGGETVRVWNLDSGECERTLPVPLIGVGTRAINPLGRLISR